MRFPPPGPLPTGAMTGAPLPNLPGPAMNMMGINPYVATGWRPQTSSSMPPLVASAPVIAPNRPVISEADIQRRMFLSQVSADLKNRASDWQEWKTPEQKFYFYNSKTQERTWSKPPVVQELDG